MGQGISKPHERLVKNRNRRGQKENHGRLLRGKTQRYVRRSPSAKSGGGNDSAKKNYKKKGMDKGP